MGIFLENNCSGILIFLNLQEKRKLVRKIGEFENQG